MKSLSIAPIFLSILLSSTGGGGVHAQQLIKIYTTYAKCRLSLPISNPSTFTVPTQQQFQFESAASKLFHNEITHRDRGELNDPYANARAVLTTVQLNDVESGVTTKTTDAAFTMKNLLTMEAVVSVTFSQVGIYKALKRSPLTGGLEEKVAPNLASLLSRVISSEELFSTLVMSGIIPPDDGYIEEVLEVSFEKFDGDFDERGMYTMGDIEIVSNGKSGFAMFMAGMFFTLVLGSSIAVGSWAYKSEHGHWPFFPNLEGGPFPFPNSQESRDIVVHSGEDDEGDAEMMLPPQGGYLGLKGHHPISSASKENSHPNGMRKRITHSDESDFSPNKSDFSPNTQVSASSKHPLGIKSMRKLNASFFTPQKPKTSLVLYDVERLTKSDEKSVKSNVVLFED